MLRDLALDPDLSGPCVAIVALAADKDAQGFVAELGGRASTIVFTELPGSSRGRPLAGLKAIATSLGLTSEVEPDASRALKRGLELAAKANAWLLVTGSLYLVGALRPAIAEAAKARAILDLQQASEPVEVNHTGMRERELLQRADTGTSAGILSMVALTGGGNG